MTSAGQTMTDDFDAVHAPSPLDDDEDSAEDLTGFDTNESGEFVAEDDSQGTSDQKPLLIDRLLAVFGFNQRAKETELHQRLEELSRMIHRHPDAAENYVVRGELYLRLHLYQDARDDFQKALDVLPERVKTDRWGLIAQVMQDRAVVGLKKAQHRLS